MSDPDSKILKKIEKALLNSEGLAIKEIAKKIGLSPSTTTKYLIKLEERGLVEKDVSKPPRKEFKLRKGKIGA